MPAFLKTHLIKIAVGALALLVWFIVQYVIISRIYTVGYNAGSATIEAKWNAERAELFALNQQLSAQVGSLQRNINAQAVQFERKSNEEKQALIADYENRLGNVRTRVERVYIPAKPAADYCDNAGAGVAGAASRIREERCELDQATVESLGSIARDGDIAIIERNVLIDRYNAARAALQQLGNTAP